MTQLYQERTQSTPEVVADWDEGRLAMAGDSYPENSYEFFGEILAWVEQFVEQAGRPLHVELRLAYLNTSSVRSMLDLFDLLQAAHGKGKEVTVEWIYDARNERIAEIAEEFREDFTFPFTIRGEEVQ